MCNLCSSAFQLGKYQKAFEHLGNALTFDPNNYKVCGFFEHTLRFDLNLVRLQAPRGRQSELLSEQFNRNKRSFSVRWCAASLIRCCFKRLPLSCNLSLISVFTPRPSWLQAAWCRPTATSTWLWTSIEWPPVPCPRALPSGTTLACAFLGKRNMWLWVKRIACLCHLETGGSRIFFFFLNSFVPWMKTLVLDSDFLGEYQCR